LAVCIYIGAWSTSMKAVCRGFGAKVHWSVMLFDESWCIPVGLLLGVVLIAKDLWCPARVVARVNLVTCLAGILIWGMYVYAASQPYAFPMPKR